jgi:hypothetical protein
MENFEITSDDISPAAWTRLLGEMRSEGVTFGTFYAIERLEAALMCKSDDIKFGIAMSHINDVLMHDGYYLSARDQQGKGYVVVEPERAEIVGDGRVKRCYREITRAIAIFAGVAHNPTAEITAEDKRRLNAKAEKNAMRLGLMRSVTMPRPTSSLKPPT